MTRFAPILSLAAFLLLGACAPASISPPAEPTHETARTFEASYDEVWDAAVDWFSESNIPIGQIERASGLIASEHQLGADDALINCGQINPGDRRLVGADRTANLNVRVRESDQSVLVQVDVFGRGQFTFNDPMTNTRNTITAPRCESTGDVESWIFEYIEDSVQG